MTSTTQHSKDSSHASHVEEGRRDDDSIPGLKGELTGQVATDEFVLLPTLLHSYSSSI